MTGGGGERNEGHSINGDGGMTDDGDLGGCGWKWKGGWHSERQEWTATITRRKDGRGRGGGDNTPMDNNDDNDNNDDDEDDNNDDDDDDNNDDNDDGDDDGDNGGNGNDDNNNTTIKQCTGVRKRRKTVTAMDDGQRQ